MTVEISTVLGQIIYSNEVELITGTTKIQPNYKIEKAGMYFVKLKSAGLPDVTKRVVLTKG